MLTENTKKLLEKHIEKLIRESIFENDFFEEKKHKKKHHNDDDDDTKKKHYDNDDDNYDNDTETRRKSIMRWLDSAQELHSVLSYDLWPDMDEDSARSEFSKKWRGEDADGKPYEFTDDEINTLFNMREDYIERAGLNK